MAYEAGHTDDKTTDKATDKAIAKAIDAFGQAIALLPDDAMAKLERNQLYYLRHDFPSAQRDLEDTLRSSDPRAASARPLVTRLLEQIANRKDAERSQDGR